MEDLMKKIITLASIYFLLTAAGCGRGEIVKDQFSYGDLKNVSAAQWESLGKKKIFFGHQSVGGNIIDGMREVIKENPQIKLSIVESDKPEDLKPGVFEHSKVGKNEQPLTKIEAFSNLVRSGIGKNADIAFFKLCYVDINKSTDVDLLFKDYRQTMAELKKAYPNVTFIHFTAPLVLQPGRNIKYMIKKMLGKETGNSNNIARNRYNELLKASYEGNEPVFDLARLESIAPDGTVSCFNGNGKRILSLCPVYTEDGGHLNETGRKVIAQQLMVFLAGLKYEG
jgi:hypothetical protein